MDGEMSQTNLVFSCFDGRTQYRETSDETREVVTLYSDGKLCSRRLLQNGRYHGICMSWHENGIKMMEEPYTDGKLNGAVSTWHKNGMLESQRFYRMGMYYGIARQWNDQGRVTSVKLMVWRTFVGVKLLEYLEGLLLQGRLTAQNIVRVRNAEIRHLLIEDMGYERFVQQLNPDIIDKDGERDLMRISFHQDDEPLYLVKVRCPSTGAYYTLRVPPTMKTAQEAVAWTFRLGSKDYHPVKET